MKKTYIYFTIGSFLLISSAFAQTATQAENTTTKAPTATVTPAPTAVKEKAPKSDNDMAKLGPSLLPGVLPTAEDYKSRFNVVVDFGPGINLFRAAGTQGSMEGNFLGSYDLLDSCRVYKDKGCAQLQPFANIAIGGYVPSGSFFVQSGLGVGGRFYFGSNRKVALSLYFSPFGVKGATGTAGQIGGLYYYAWIQPAVELNLGKMISSKSAQGWSLRFGGKLGGGGGSPGAVFDFSPTVGISYQPHSS